MSMVQASGAENERKIIAILKVLSESSEPLGSITIARELERHGISLSERAIRYHLQITDERGYTQPMGRDGRMLTPIGIEELRMALAPEKLNFINEKLELLAFQTTFDPVKRSGLLPINTTLIDNTLFPTALEAMAAAFDAGVCVSQLVATAAEGEKLGSIVVPEGKTGLATVCGAVVNGVLLKSGVPVESRFGGVLEIKNHKPKRFIAVISYGGTSVDPSEQFIRAHMTSVGEIARTGSGKMLANFRELPAPARATVAEKITLLKEAGINGVYVLGNTSETICQLTVGINRIGMVLVGGLNPLAAVFEQGITMDNFAESGMIEYQQLVNFHELSKTR
jgi:HTH-type transcriptional regulator, global nitrogen regulator NrpRI